jgi:hypothetical protein
MEESLDKELPQLRITSIDTDTSGKPNLSFEVDDDFLEYVKKEKGIEEVSQQVLSEFVKSMLEKCSNKEDGYGYIKLNTDKDKDE